ncbi:MAG: hypothetical protein A2832_02335 [Candidatus Zambryskibacteria bacterium RIFCSPHIGHO2_01_FULL_44_22b]|uniref:Glycosyl transferase family 1 domain-containing protein n=1 Tax=Candidatus Zambryskibacteria bacterium RIFCSPHIGHO2_01_FULL_44_22b TaxID=1802737 RepID=A0A1G2T2E8_9BACT|nr:MAG: hypothetical protein A3A98_02490 [Candidatus Staskawiczbacteria bacterium RIFCSPLOWO2_01_FULL_40_39]OHA91424.1 MAG: hypothetical protein A2832_02335 [Candidatus Zambryskibacteria bacterium RIFCSPHIGHO2_01_FULL_44_22b]
MAHRKILIFSLSYFPVVGGAEVAVKELTDRITDFEFDMVTMRFNRSHPRFEKIGSINVYRIGGGLGYLSKIIFVPQAALFAMRRKYDFYWCIMTYMLFPAILARRAPYVLTLQDGDPFERIFNRWFILPFRPLLHYGIKHAIKIQAISTFLAKWAKRSDVEVIPNGVDVERFKNPGTKISGDKVTLITTSRLVEKNAVGDIIEAVKHMPENTELQILGGGPLEESLKSKTKNLKLENRVKFLGEISQADLPRYLHEADIFIRPSLSEGQGISFIEAMAAGLPVIATPVGGIPDFLKDGETGLFVEVKSPRLIAFQVHKILSDIVLRDRLIINAKRMVVARYDWNLIAQEMKSRVFDVV